MNGLRKWLKIHPECVNALSGLYLISTRNMSRDQMMLLRLCVNALSSLYLISTSERVHMNLINFFVSMPSRAYTSFLRRKWIVCSGTGFGWCQCPLGPIPHFYGVDKGNTDHEEFFCVNALSGLYLISTGLWIQSVLFWERVSMPSRAYTSFLRKLKNVLEECEKGVNALSGLYLISTVPLQKPRFYAVSRACFCRYLSEYSDNSRFSCMLTFWTYLMRCTYPWHWIKYSTNYNRCHPIFSLSW